MDPRVSSLKRGYDAIIQGVLGQKNRQILGKYGKTSLFCGRFGRTEPAEKNLEKMAGNSVSAQLLGVEKGPFPQFETV